MKRTLLGLMLACGVICGTGCTMCCSPYDYAYSAYHGRWQRGDMSHGRVGSAFAPAEAIVTEGPQPAIYHGETIIEHGQ